MTDHPVVYVSCPPAAHQSLMRRYRLKVLRDSFLRGEVPINGDLMYEHVQKLAPTALSYAEHLVMRRCERLVVYADHGIGPSTSYLLKMAPFAKIPVEFRYIIKRGPNNGEGNQHWITGAGGDIEVQS